MQKTAYLSHKTPITFKIQTPALLVAIILLAAFVSDTPQVQAFWPFFSTANADSLAVAPDPATPALAAALNPDPNPNKDLGTSIDASGGAALVANAGPSGTIADVASTTSATDQISLYIVKPGDTLSQIATMFGVSVNTIVWANDLGSSKAVHAGQTLAILPITGIQHTVVKGETLASLAKKYGGDATDIANYNGLAPDSPLSAGMVVIIPGGELAAPVAATGKHPRITLKNPFRGGSGPEIDGYFANPVPGAVLTQSVHGWNAVDLGAQRGTPIHAAANGTVIIARSGGWNGGYGSYVVIAHGNGTETLYAHMSKVSASVGEAVSQGAVIGYVGTSGEATGPHLHYEVRGAVNPFINCPVGAVCQPQ